jgi:type I restriction enzyme S subunit
LYDSDKLFQYETGTTGIKNFGYKYFSEEVSFALPNFDLLKIFNELIETFLIKKGTNLKEIITLTNLRDILLPKLISGELKIPDAENLVEKAGI